MTTPESQTEPAAPAEAGYLPRDAMPKGSVYFAGVLYVARSKRKGRPTLLVSAFCPYCQRPHSYSWRSDLPVTPEVVIPVRAGCKSGPWRRHAAYVGLAANEPATERSRKAHAQALAEYAAWAAEMAARSTDET
jgi:hypothetical protein